MSGLKCGCGGELRAVRVEHFSRWGKDGAPVLVTDVPAWRCDRCGEIVFDSEVAHRLSDLVRAGALGTTRFERLSVKEFAPARG